MSPHPNKPTTTQATLESMLTKKKAITVQQKLMTLPLWMPAKN